MLELTGFLGLTRIPLGFWAHTDLTDPTVLLCGWEISQMVLRVGWLARIPLCFWAHTDLTDPTVLLCGWEISQMLLCVGCAHADSAWFLGSHGSHFLGSHGFHRSHGVALWVENLTDGSVGVGSWGLHGARSHGLIFWTLRTNQTYRTNRTDWTFLKIIREICGICVRPPWDWDLCEASVDSVWAGDKITKNCVIWGAF